MNNSWYTEASDINSPDTIHQIFAYGTLDEIIALRKKLGVKKLTELFLNYPKKVYIKSSLSFIINFILQINFPVDEQKYLKDTPRSIG